MPSFKQKYCTLAPIKAVIVRLTFVIHSLVAVYRVVAAYENELFWLLSLLLIGLLIETVITLVKRSGKEWTWFSPAIFFYLLSSVPSIWLLELQLSLKRAQPFNSSENGTASEDALTETIGIDIPLDLSGWALAMEQALLFIVILGRWFMPKGSISKDQLSQILLVYLGMAADIMELFEVFKEEQVARSFILTYPTLSLWTIALLQYTLALGSSNDPESGEEIDKQHNNNDGGKNHQNLLRNTCGLDSANIEVLGIMTTIIMQDGPFLCYRLYLLVGLGVLSQMMVFFTCKNLLVILLQIYRLIVIYQDGKKEQCVDKLNEGIPSREHESSLYTDKERNTRPLKTKQQRVSPEKNPDEDENEMKSISPQEKKGKGSTNRITPTPPETCSADEKKQSWQDSSKPKNPLHPNSVIDTNSPTSEK